MFAPFKTGRDEYSDRAGWDDTPTYARGRFHAHALPPPSATPPPPSSPSAAAFFTSPLGGGGGGIGGPANNIHASTLSSPPARGRRGGGLGRGLGPLGGPQGRVLRFGAATSETVDRAGQIDRKAKGKGKAKAKDQMKGDSSKLGPPLLDSSLSTLDALRQLCGDEGHDDASQGLAAAPTRRQPQQGKKRRLWFSKRDMRAAAEPEADESNEDGDEDEDRDGDGSLLRGPQLASAARLAPGLPNRFQPRPARHPRRPRPRLDEPACSDSASASDGDGNDDRLNRRRGRKGWPFLGGVGTRPRDLLRPGRKTVNRWLSSWSSRWTILVGLPCCIVWLWCAVPFPVKDPFSGEEPPWNMPMPWPGDGPALTTRTTTTTTRMAQSIVSSMTWALNSVGASASGAVVEQNAIVSEIRRRRRRDSAQQVLQLDLVDFTTSNTELTDAGQQAPDSRQGPRSNPADGDGGDGDGHGEDDLPVDANFYFFLFAYYGVYLAVALIFVTKLFDLYRLNWWPSTLGGTASYLSFWLLSLLIGFLLHRFDLDGLGRRSHRSRRPQPDATFDWERKTTWVLLAFFAMALPALACFGKLRADRRQSYRRSLTAAQKTFLDRQLSTRMPRSYKRFLWFVLNLALGLFALLIGQGFATVYLSTLPHNNVDGLVYVWSWIATCNVLNATSNWILQHKVRSRALVFVFRFYYFLVYHVFYRNLFARLRSPDQAIFIQLLSSSFVIFWYPISMSKTFHRLMKWSVGLDSEWEEYAEGVGTMLYLRNLSENVTMAAFLGWLTILHYGPNKAIYPFFAFESAEDPYTYRLTATASLIIWATELGSSFVARVVIWFAYELDVTNLGLDEFRQHPELVVACVWTSIHVCMDMLLFLIKLNFR